MVVALESRTCGIGIKKTPDSPSQFGNGVVFCLNGVKPVPPVKITEAEIKDLYAGKESAAQGN